MDGNFVRLKEKLMASFPELEVRHIDRKLDVGWTEKQALDSALLENPVTVLMYCLHAMHIHVRHFFQPTAVATVVDVGGVDTEEGGATAAAGGAEIDVGGVEKGEDNDDEEEEEEETDGYVEEDNAVTIDQISDWLKVNLHLLRASCALTVLCMPIRSVAHLEEA